MSLAAPQPTAGPSRRSVLKAMGFGGAAALVSPALLSACSGSSSGPTSLHFVESKAEVIPYFDTLLANFNKSQNKFSAWHDQSQFDALIADFVRGSVPDVDCDNYQQNQTSFITRGVLADLRDLPVTATIAPGAQKLITDSARYKDEISILPFSLTAAGTFYNKALFDKADVSVPTTWTELLAVCEKLKSKGILPFYGTFADTWTAAQGPFDYAVGGSLDVADFYAKLTAQGTNVGANTPVSFQKNFREPCEKLVQLLPFFNEDADRQRFSQGNLTFASGAAAMYLQGPWAVSGILAANPKIELGTFPLPMTDDPADLRARVNVDLGLWMPRELSGARREGARALISYLLSPAVVNAYNLANLAFSPIKGAPPQTNPIVGGLQKYVSAGQVYLPPTFSMYPSIPVKNYVQELVTSRDVNGFLSKLDTDWKRNAKRLQA